MSAPKPGARRLDVRLEPVSGKAIPLYRGEVLRISQIEGCQPVSFNCFSLRDHKEYMSIGYMRREGFRSAVDRFIWSNPPRYRPMMKILDMSPTCLTDSLDAACSAMHVEAQFGIPDHPNCQDTLAECIGEFGLMPDDVHDPLNLWLNNSWDHIGAYNVWNTGRAGDYIDLLATMDVLAVPAICGAADFSVSGNFSYKPIQVEVYEASAETGSLAEQEWRKHTSLKTQLTPPDFKNQLIKTDRELKADPSYRPDFLSFPIECTEIEVTFTSSEYQQLWQHRGTYGDTDEEVVRTLFFHWYVEYRKKHGLRWYSPRQSHA
jgi:uncharacterized protein YcgI (DUF1989 family)